VTTEHLRKCWDCGTTNAHKDNVMPWVLCPQCGSQDTRAVELKFVPVEQEQDPRIAAYEAERDESPVDLDFAKRVSAEFYQYKHLLIAGCTDHYLYVAMDGHVALHLGGVGVASNPTVGEFWTRLRLHKITLEGKNNGE
jgi:hypothetical protein